MTSKTDLQPKGTGSYTEKLAVTAGSLTALAVLPLCTQAGIVTGTETFTVTGIDGASNLGADWDLDGGAPTPFAGFGRAQSTAASSLFNDYAIFGFFGNAVGSLAGSSDLSAVGSGATVYAGSILGYGAAAPSSSFTLAASGSNFAAGPNYIGFKTDNDNYGWLKLVSGTLFDDFSGTLSVSFTVDYAYEECGSAIHVGHTSSNVTCSTPSPMPEPPVHALILLGLGAAGVTRWRRERKIKAAA